MAEVDNASDMVARIIENLERVQAINWASGVKDELQGIKVTLLAISALLLRLQEQRFTSNSMIYWLQNLEFVVIDLDDVIDLILTRDLELKEYGRSLFWSFTQLFTNGNVTRELKAIHRCLDKVFQQWGAIPGIVGSAVQGETDSYVCASDVIGREEDKKRIIHRLISSSDLDADCSFVIPIVGIGGIGKTTLAHLIYNDPSIVESFDMRLWANVTGKFEKQTWILAILQSSTHVDFSDSSLEELGNELVKRIRGKTFLLVLDDFCPTVSMEWMYLKELLGVGAPASRIIVTTREKGVALITGVSDACNLGRLSDDECWCIFSKYAFVEGEEKADAVLVGIGKSIVKKCCGNPLAARTLGCILNGERDFGSWLQIQRGELWSMNQSPDDILPVLKLGYDRVPSHLQSCFALCALHRKGEPLFRTELINMWMALGLLQSRIGNEDPEDIGERYFDQLLSKSFFEFPSDDVAHKVIVDYGEAFSASSLWTNLRRIFVNDSSKLKLVLDKFVQPDKLFFVEIHNLMHDLATFVSMNEIAIFTRFWPQIPARTIHILWNLEDVPNFSWVQVKKARSFTFSRPMREVSKPFVEGLISSLRFLRILNLSFSQLEELPKSLGELKLLRYLTLCWNLKIVGLPESTCKLVNLQTLDLFKCIEFEKLPLKFHRLVSLRFLSLTSKLKCLPECLFGLSFLRVLRLSFCEHLSSLPDGIGKLQNLRQLEIICCGIYSLPDEMKCLARLEQLKIFCCKNLDLEAWEGLKGLLGLTCLDLKELPKLASLPCGIKATTSLVDLWIQNCESLERLTEELVGCTSLLRLTLNGLPRLANMPLSIQKLKSLRRFNISECPGIETRCVEGGRDWDLISHIPEIVINGNVIGKGASQT